MAEDKRAAKRQRYSSRIITLKPTHEDEEYEEEFTVHEDRLREHSPFFRAALDKKWKEGSAGEIELPEDKTDVVAAYVHWLYEHSVDMCKDDEDDVDYDIMVEMYVFGEMIQDDGFCDAVIVALTRGVDHKDKEGCHLFPCARAIRVAYEATPAGSPLRRLMVDIFAECAELDWESSPNLLFTTSNSSKMS